jgi:DNA-binding MarR family transcriptional regulator
MDKSSSTHFAPNSWNLGKREKVEWRDQYGIYHLLFVRMSSPEGEVSRKDQIHTYIKEHPGTHLREVCRKLSLAMGVVQYHLSRLERDRTVVSRRRGLYKRYYANLVFAEKDQDILDVLSQETEREILLFLTQRSGSSQKEIAEFSKLSPATVNWHVKRLLSSGIIEANLGEDSLLRYSIVGDKRIILNLLKNYHPAIWEVWADRLADVWFDFSSLNSGEGGTRESSDFEY